MGVLVGVVAGAMVSGEVVGLVGPTVVGYTLGSIGGAVRSDLVGTSFDEKTETRPAPRAAQHDDS